MSYLSSNSNNPIMKKLNERYHKKEEEFKKKAMEFDEFLLTGSKVTPEPVINHIRKNSITYKKHAG